jgi:hypothetical protein
VALERAPGWRVKGMAERVGSLEEERAADRRRRRDDGDFPATPLRKTIADAEDEGEREGSSEERRKRLDALRKEFDDDTDTRLGDRSRQFLDKCADDDDATLGRDALRLRRDDDDRSRRRDDDDARSRRRRDAEEGSRRDPAFEQPGSAIYGPTGRADRGEWGLGLNPDVVADRRLSATMAECQWRADKIAAIFSASAPHPMQGEKLSAYRRRLLRPFQKYSELYKKLDLATLGTLRKRRKRGRRRYSRPCS